jgi:hypothetical protein
MLRPARGAIAKCSVVCVAAAWIALLGTPAVTAAMEISP